MSGSGRCDVELDHQGAMVADGRGDHPGALESDDPGWVVAEDMVQLLGRSGIGPGAAPPGLGQPRRETKTSTVEGMFKSPTSSRGAARDPASCCSSRSWRS